MSVLLCILGMDCISERAIERATEIVLRAWRRIRGNTESGDS